MFKKMSIRGKILSICTVIAFFSLAIGAISFYSLKQVVFKYDHVVKINMGNLTGMTDMMSAYRRARTYATALGLAGISAEKKEETAKKILDSVEKYKKADAAYNEVPFVEGEEAVYKTANEAWKVYTAQLEGIIALSKSGDPASSQKLLQALLHDLPKAGDTYSSALEALVKFQGQESSKWSQEAETTAKRSNWTILTLIIVVFAAAFVIGAWFATALGRSLMSLAENMSQGAEEVASASLQISKASTDLSSSTTEQAAALQETVASLDEVSAMVNKNSDNARNSQELSKTGQEAASKGKRAVDEMISSIEEINRSNAEVMTQVEASNREISDIVKVIAEIGQKTKVINDIVFQTKLLSFNASVEAARAGEHGKGFAVVAEEVGNLATMSGNAAKEISTLLDGSIQKVEGIVSQTKTRVERLMITGKEKVEAGTATAKNCGAVLDEIVGHISNIVGMTSEIATASKEQSQGVQEINKAMAQLDQVTQMNSSASQETSTAAESLTLQADQLRLMVKGLRDTIQGGQGEAPAQGTATAKVIPIRKSEASAKATQKIVARHAAPQAKKVANGGSLPAENDPRFEDI